MMPRNKVIPFSKAGEEIIKKSRVINHAKKPWKTGVFWIVYHLLFLATALFFGWFSLKYPNDIFFFLPVIAYGGFLFMFVFMRFVY